MSLHLCLRTIQITRSHRGLASTQPETVQPYLFNKRLEFETFSNRVVDLPPEIEGALTEGKELVKFSSPPI